MDDPNLDRASHLRALRGLQRINALSRTVATVWRPLVQLIRERRLTEPVILDLATGGGALAIGLMQRAARHSMSMRMVAADLSPVALDITRERAAAANITIDTVCLDALDADWPSGIDIVVNSLFLHHLADDDATTVLRHASMYSNHGMIMSDLRRTRRGLSMAHIGVRVLSRSPIVHADGPQSVRAAFTMPELDAIARRASLHQPQITAVWPQRQQLIVRHEA